MHDFQCICLFTSQSNSTQQFLQHDLFKPLTPDQALAIPSFFHVEGSIRFNLGDIGFNWIYVDPKLNWSTWRLDFLWINRNILFVWPINAFLFSSNTFDSSFLLLKKENMEYSVFPQSILSIYIYIKIFLLNGWN